MSAAGSYTKDEPKLFANIERLTLIKCACEALWDIIIWLVFVVDITRDLIC